MKDKNYDIQRNISFRILSDAAREHVNEAALTILETIGMKVTGERTVEKFREKGITPDPQGIVYIPRALVKSALASVPHELTLYGMDKKPRMKIDSKNRVYFGTHADQLQILDHNTNTARPFLKKDIELMCKLCNSLDNIDFTLTVGLVADVPPQVQSQVSFIETMKYHQKTVNFSTNTIEALQECIDIAAIVAGSKQELIEKPFIFNYCEPIPPLTHPIESTEKLFISAENMIPVVYMPYCMMGGTSPLDKASTLAQCYAEILAGLVISQLANPGAPFIIGSMPSIFDMRTTIGSYGAPEFHLMVAASSEMADYYDLPFYGTAGCSDAKTIDMQSAGEISMEIFSTLLSKANIVHDVGVLDHCNSVSPVAVVLADEIIEAQKHYMQGLEIDDLNDIDLSLIKDVGHGKHHLNEDNTLDRFSEIWYPKYFSRKMVNPNESDIMESMKAFINGVTEKNPGSYLEADVLMRLEELEKKYLDSCK